MNHAQLAQRQPKQGSLPASFSAHKPARAMRCMYPPVALGHIGAPATLGRWSNAECPPPRQQRRGRTECRRGGLDARGREQGAGKQGRTLLERYCTFPSAALADATSLPAAVSPSGQPFPPLLRKTCHSCDRSARLKP